MSTSPDRVPPQSVEAEQSVLGSMLLDRDAVTRGLELLKETDFYREQHREIFSSMARLFERGEAIDMVTVTEDLRKVKTLEQVGGISYVATLANMVPTSAHIERYARIVAQKSTLRQLLAAATSIVSKVYDGRPEVEEVLDEAEQVVFSISQGMQQRGFEHLRDALVKAFERIEFLYANKGRAIGVPTGLGHLDELLSGFQPADLIILAARPSMGKTTLALNFAAHASIQHEIPVAIFSLEMSCEQVAQRLLCSQAQVDGQRLRTGNLQQDDWPRLSQALGRLSQAPMFIDDTPSLSVMELRARARRLKSEHNIGLMIVDYLQLMHAKGRVESRQQEISEITRSLKGLARELELPIIVLSQLSRAVEQREGRRPQLSDLRESGAIEQDADVVGFIYFRPEQEDEFSQRRLAEIIIAKQRTGPTGSCNVVFMKDLARFAETAPDDFEPPDLDG